MRITRVFLLLFNLIFLLLIGCKSTKVFIPETPNVKKIVFLKNKTEVSEDNIKNLESIVRGSSVNYSSSEKAYIWKAPKGGVVLSGKKQKGDGSQKENQEPLMWIKAPIIIRGDKNSPWVIKDNKDGIRFYSDNWGLEEVIFLNSGEDCVTSYAKNGRVYKSIFIGDSNADKCIQASVANGLEIINNKFYNFETAIQFGLRKYSSKRDLYLAEDNEFINCSTAIRAVKGQLKEKNNKLNGAKVIIED